MENLLENNFIFVSIFDLFVQFYEIKKKSVKQQLAYIIRLYRTTSSYTTLLNCIVVRL